MSTSGADRSRAGNFYDTVGNVELGDDLGAGDSVLSSYNDSPMGNVNEVPTVLLRAQYTEELKQVRSDFRCCEHLIFVPRTVSLSIHPTSATYNAYYGYGCIYLPLDIYCGSIIIIIIIHFGSFL
ncbi:hypothetical protein D915_011069 [Fasciola hepatica]|uniref:Uncharacterized protein n=1 Tax=Fasciola hepatica TaxID=6192 RepID=A0A4E0RV94_FASHE|nr:hypothetical protein D915_011069 [Fasciola hepatica]